MIATNVGWVEERRRAAASRRVTQHPNALYMLGFTSFKRPVATTGGTPATHWLPNLRICRILFLNWY